MKTKKILLIALLFGTTGVLTAQTETNQWAIGVHGGSTKYSGDLGGNALTDFTHSQYFLGYFNCGLSLTKYYNPSIDFGLLSDIGLYGTYSNFTKKFIATKFENELFAHYKLNNGYILDKDSKFAPFLSLGLGLASYSTVEDYPTWADPSPVDFIVPVGVGFKYQFTPAFALQYKYQYNFTSNDNHDLIVRGGNDAWGEHLVGVVFSLGRTKHGDSNKKDDQDNDGIPDNMDKCPGTPAGVKVDGFGCPLDSDKDGVADYLDKELDTPQCTKVDANGVALDTDKDGVPDFMDKCPGTPAGVKVDGVGCPLDSDNDGVADYMDQCPSTPTGVAVDSKGCPIDTDGDGVPDYLDKCSNTPANTKVDANGCPLDNASIYHIQLKDVYFDSGKSLVKPMYNAELAKAVELLKKYPESKMQLNGYADSLGSDAFNQKLSEKRANAVKDYLIKKGINASRIISTGYGEAFPKGDNNTQDGRALNRRVELK